MLNRRGFMAGLIATAVAARSEFADAAKKDNKTGPVTAFYRHVTRNAYDKVFKDTLTSDKIKSDADLEKALETNWPAYKAAFISSAKDYIGTADPESLSALKQPHKWSRGYSGPLKDDRASYLKNGRGYSSETGVQKRDGNEGTNPLFLRIHDLSLEGKITREMGRQAIDTIADATFSEDIYMAVKEAYVARAKAAPVSNDTFKLELK